MNLEKQIKHWSKGAAEDLAVARHLLDRGNKRHGLFFLHLAVEKLLKAHVCKTTRNLAPKTHNLLRLAELAGLELTEKQRELLADVNSFNLEGRYPELTVPLPTLARARRVAGRAGEVFQWLTARL